VSSEVYAPVEGLEIESARAMHVLRWLNLLGGVAVWGCLDLSTPGRKFYTPATLTDGTPSPRPHWSATQTPERIITDATGIDVVDRYEVKRIRITVRKGPYGMRWQLTDHSSKRLKAALAEVGEEATYTFEGNEAIIQGVSYRIPLDRWLKENIHGKE